VTNVDSNRLEKRLASLFDKAKDFGFNPELQANWSCYLCVLTSGYLERAIAEEFLRYCHARSSGSIARYVAKDLERFQNPKMAKILQLTERFSKDWAETLKERTPDEVKAAVDSIVANKNRIAHGESVSLGLVTMENYFKEARKIVRHLKEILGG